jgi:hypothetical protein
MVANRPRSLMNRQAGTGLVAGSGNTLDVDLSELPAKTTPIMADSVGLIDSEDSDASSKATLTNVLKILGETAAGTNATSGLSETDGVMKVNVGGITSNASPVAANKVIVEQSGVNKSVTLANMAAFYRAIAQMPVDIASSLFFFATAFDFSTSASLVATKISDHTDATALAAKGKLIAAIIAVTQVANGTTTDVISIAKDGTPTVKLCGDLTITIADVTNKVGCAFMLMPVSGANAIVDPATEDIYVVAASSSGRTTGKVYVVLVFQKTA